LNRSTDRIVTDARAVTTTRSFAMDVQTGIREVLRKQAEIGIDSPSDGDYVARPLRSG